MLLTIVHGRTFNRTLAVLIAPIVAMIVIAMLSRLWNVEQPWDARHLMELRLQGPRLFWSLVSIVAVGVVANWQIAKQTRLGLCVPRYYLFLPVITLGALAILPFTPPEPVSKTLPYPLWNFVCLCGMAYLGILDLVQFFTHGLDTTNGSAKPQ